MIDTDLLINVKTNFRRLILGKKLPDHAFCTFALLFHFQLFNRPNLI